MEARKKQRRSDERRAQDRRSDLLRSTFEGETAESIDAHLAVRDARIEIRCPATTKLEIEAVAGRYGLTVTTYLLRLHELAASRLDAKRKD